MTGIAQQIEDVIRKDPRPFLPLLGTLFIFLVAANLSGILPGVEAPTGKLETPAALALIVFFSVHYFGVRARGFRGYLASFAEPKLIMLPLNILSEVTRTFSLMVRLFGNVMSGEFVIALVVALAGLFVPDPAHGPRNSGRPRAGLHLHRSRHRLHRRRGRQRREKDKGGFMDVKLIAIIGAVIAVSIGSIGPALAEGALGRRGHGRDRASARGGRHDLTHALRRPRNDRDDGDLLPGGRAAPALRQSICRLTMHLDWWTIALQTINFAILVWLLHRFLYKPVLRMIDARKAEIAAAIR